MPEKILYVYAALRPSDCNLVDYITELYLNGKLADKTAGLSADRIFERAIMLVECGYQIILNKMPKGEEPTAALDFVLENRLNRIIGELK